MVAIQLGVLAIQWWVVPLGFDPSSAVPVQLVAARFWRNLVDRPPQAIEVSAAWSALAQSNSLRQVRRTTARGDVVANVESFSTIDV